MNKKYLTLFSLAGFLISLDQLTKVAVRMQLAEGETRNWFGLVSLSFYRNQGAAFNMIKNLPPSIQNLFLIAVPVFALFLIILIFIKLQDNQMLTSLALTSILGGAIGNMIDRFESGSVVDILQIRLRNWNSPPFNLADASILLGVGIVFINTLVQERREQK